MITGLILGFIADVVSGVLGSLPSVPVPSWLNGNDSAFATVFQYGDSMSVWFPTQLVETVVAAWLVVKLAGFGIKVARIVASFLTGGGGSAA